jgi:hypothetical protein
MKLKLYFLSAMFFIIAAPLLYSDTVYVIREIEFDIIGRSRPFALINHGEFKYGERIEGRENLDRYLNLKRQLLINQQVLEEVRIDYSLGESEADGALPVKLLVHVRDTWNLVILPQPEYDSNDGFTLTLKARNYNFLGTMSALRIDFGYNQNDGERQFNSAIEMHFPFHAAGLNWRFRFDHFLGYALEDSFYYQTVTGLSLELPWRNTTFTVGINQFLTFNEENSDENRETFNLDERFFGTYYSTELFASWEIPLGLEVGDYGEIKYTPGVSGRINYPFASMDETRKPVATISNSIGFGRVNWIGNFRSGLSTSIGISHSWFIDRDDAPFKIGLDGDISFFLPVAGFWGLSSRLNYRAWWHWSDRLGAYVPHFNSGDKIRGVLNNYIRAYQILTFSLDIPVRVLRFWPSEWFKNESLRFFNFEMHFSPFTDYLF